MDKVLVSLSVPSVDLINDVYIPDFIQIKEIIPLLIQATMDLSDHRYVSSENEVLCLQDKNIILNPEASLSQLGIKNGDNLVML